MYRTPEQPVYKCDRCGQFFAYELRHADAGHPYDADARNIIERKVPAERGYIGYSPVDLCGSCVHGFRVFLRPNNGS